MDESPGLSARMRASITETVVSSPARVRSMSASALVGMLSAAALAPVIVAGRPEVAGALAGVLGSVGANILTNVIAGGVGKLRGPGNDVEPSEAEIRQAVADRVAAAFTAVGPADQDLRGEVIGLFQAVDVAGTALRAAAEADGLALATAMAGAFVEVSAMFGEFGYVLTTTRLSLEALRQDLRQEMVRQHADRERARRSQADIGRILDGVLGLQRRAAHEETAGGERARWDGCPYRGLQAFEESDAAVFYGRRDATASLLDRLREQLAAPGILLVIGPSGAGKSSLLRAGLLAAVSGDRFAEGSRTWPRAVVTPAPDPLLRLATHLADLAGIDAMAVHASLTARPEQAHLLAAQIMASQSADARLVLVVDQLEELFAVDRAHQAAFLTALDAMARTPARPDGQSAALVVAALRGDFLESAVRFPPLARSVAAGMVTVTEMTESELAEAITGPAAEAGRMVPGELVTAIVDDLRDRHRPAAFDAGALPLLSEIMFVLWSAGLTVEAYRRAGGAADIVHNRAEGTYLALAPVHREIARRTFLHLAVAVDGKPARRPSTTGALRAATGSAPWDLDIVLDSFTRERLLTRAIGDRVSISHEELLRSWRTLRDWLTPSLTDQALHRALIDDAQVWQEHDRDPSYLYQGAQLQAVRVAAAGWAKDPARALPVDAATGDFLRAGTRRYRRRRVAYRVVAASMAVLLVVALVAAVVAGQSARRAGEQHALALSRQLAAQSLIAAAEQWRVSQQLAAAALRTAPTREAADAAGAALGHYHDLLGHPVGRVSGLAFSPDGKMLATAGFTATVWLWNPITGESVRGPLTGHTSSVTAVAFSPDGKLLASAGDDTVRLWNPTTGKPVGDPLATDAKVTSVVFSPDGTLLAAAGGDNTVRLWNAATREPVGQPITAAGSVLAFRSDGLLAIGGRTARLWDASTQQPVGEPLTGCGFRVAAMAFSGDGGWLAAACEGGTAQRWNLAAGQTAGSPLTGRAKAASAVALDPEGRLLAAAGDDGRIQLYDPASGRSIGAPLIGHRGPVHAVAFSPDGKQLASAGDDKVVRLWSTATRKPVGSPLTGHRGSVHAVAFEPGGGLLASAGADGTARLWNPSTHRPGRRLSGHTGAVKSVAFEPGGQLVATAGDDSSIRFWDTSTGKPDGRPLTVEKFGVRAVAYSPDGKQLASAGHQSVQLWNPIARVPVGKPVVGHGIGVEGVAYSRRGELLASAGVDDSAQFWSSATEGPTALTLPTSANAMALSADGRLVATGNTFGVIRIWQRSNGREIGVVHDATAGGVSLHALAFSPDGKLLAAAGKDGAVRLWDVATREPVGATMTGHTGNVHAVTFSADGKLLASAGEDGTVRLWDVARYRDPIRNLCAQVGDIDTTDWLTYAAGETQPEVCG